MREEVEELRTKVMVEIEQIKAAASDEITALRKKLSSRVWDIDIK